MGENSAISWCDHTFNPWHSRHERRPNALTASPYGPCGGRGGQLRISLKGAASPLLARRLPQDPLP
jgi:hypothetical protein